MTWRSLMQKRAFLYFLALPFFMPYSMKFIPGLTKVYDLASLWKLGSVLLIFLLYFFRHRISRSMLLIFALHLIFFLSSILHGLSQQSVYTELLPALALPMLMEMGIDADTKKVLQVLCNILSVLVLINFLLLMFYPLGLPFATLYTQTRNPLHFLGQDNGIGYTLLALLGLTHFLSEEDYLLLKVKVASKEYPIIPRVLFFDVISLITMLCVGSVTGLLVIGSFILLIGWGRLSKKEYVRWIPMGLYAAFFVVVIIGGEVVPILASLTDLLGRDVGFTGRVLLWERAVTVIRQNPLLGLGNDPMVIPIWGKLFSAHNQLLDIGVRGGVAALVLFVSLHIRGFRILKGRHTKKANILFAAMVCFLLGGLMESGVRPMQYVFLILASSPHLYGEEGQS